MRIFRSSVAVAAGIAATLSVAAPVSTADAMTLGIQDQGAAPAALRGVYDALGATSVRLVVRPGEPELEQVRVARRMGAQVQAAVLLKRWHTAGDVRALMRAWDGQVTTVSIGNEPELNGLAPCAYASLYRRAYSVLRTEYPGVRVGFGEFSPTDPIGYMTKVAACPGPRLRVSFVAGHFYQFHSDPLAPAAEERAMGAGLPGWTGLGDLARVDRALGRLRHRIGTPAGRKAPIRCTEFAYLTSGGYATTAAKTAWLWPRAVKQARRWCQQLIVYGIGAVHDGSNWGSSSLLDRFGRRMPGYLALARALGRTLPPEDIDAPPRVIETAPPGQDVVPLTHGEGPATQANDDPPAAEPPAPEEPAPPVEEVAPEPEAPVE